MFVHNATLINLTYFRRLIVKAHFNIYVAIVVVTSECSDSRI